MRSYNHIVWLLDIGSDVIWYPGQPISIEIDDIFYQCMPHIKYEIKNIETDIDRGSYDPLMCWHYCLHFGGLLIETSEFRCDDFV